jgi:catechol 2,3-dioxygenase-like lactoylglutathione lyase family enzyme
MTWHRVVIAVVTAGALVTPGLARAADYHHVHITAASPSQAVSWYARHMGCEPLADRSDAANCYGVEVVFVPQPTSGGSQGTGVDHIGFSFRDLTAKMAELEAVGVRGSGVRLQRNPDGSTLRDIPGLFKLGFIFDPWGTRIELVEDLETLGFHHVHLSASDPAATLAWYRDVMGGEPASLKGRLDGLRFDNVWFLVTAYADGTPGTTVERAIDHVGFVVDDLDTAAVDLRQRGVVFEQEPAVPEGGRTAAKRAFLAGPDNVRVAVIETGFAGVDVELGAAILTTDALGAYDAPRTPWASLTSRASGPAAPRPASRSNDPLTPRPDS